MSEALRAGYKLTEVGVIPEDWAMTCLDSVAKVIDSLHQTPTFSDDGYAMVRVTDIKTGNLNLNGALKVSATVFTEFISNYAPKRDDIVLSRVGSYGVSSFVDTDEPFCMGQNTVVIQPRVPPRYLYYVLNSPFIRRQIEDGSYGSGYKSLSLKNIKELSLPVPHVEEEQRAIAAALSDIDALLAKLDMLIAKKRNIKQATMQQLLTGQTRLPGFSGEWEVKRLGDITECLDNVRVPLNESQRNQMRGEYPYCGANGVLDYVNDYVLDDDVILMAEDGGYFDEYAYRPIAYRMIGKCWINNHAHILKAKAGCDQSLLFYLLVHKNIQSFLASGTRAKLNKSEMNKIEVYLSADVSEQTAIAAILFDMDAELATLETRRDKTQALKQGMMQELLTGRIRLV
jgi:type I restriction enzyme S subunit